MKTHLQMDEISLMEHFIASDVPPLRYLLFNFH